jgi:cation diffusion facilitator family transporter
MCLRLRRVVRNATIRVMAANCEKPDQQDHLFGQGRRSRQERGVLLAAILTLVVMIGEVFVGWWSRSMALLADGVHMGTHALALGIALAAYVLARRFAADRRFSFGTGKLSELAGFASAVLLGVGALAIAVEALQRFFVPAAIAYDEALIAAVIGLLANLVSLWILHDRSGQVDGHGIRPRHGDDHAHDHAHDHDHGPDHSHDNNLRAVILHVLADTLTSVGAIAALLAARTYGWTWLDPAIALFAVVLILTWSLSLIRTTARVLLDREAPEELRREVCRALEADGDSRVLDLHIWSVGPGVMTVVASVVTHLNKQPDEYKRALAQFALTHPVIEVQRCHIHGPAQQSVLA